MDDEHDQPGAPAPARVRPADRYGDDRPPWHRTAARAGAVLLAVAGVAWVVWAGLHQGDKDVVWDDIGFSITDSSQVVVTFDVTKDVDATVTCRLEALNRTYAVVGVAEVEIGPVDSRTTRHREPVTTQETAVTGLVKGCETR